MFPEVCLHCPEDGNSGLTVKGFASIDDVMLLTEM